MAAPPPPPAPADGQSAISSPLKSKSSSECVKVVVRVRPLSSKEISEGREVIVTMDTKRGVAILHRPGGTDRDAKDFTFDAVFGADMTQQQIFDDTAADILDSVMDGFNGTIFAYGQTGAGKSHTMSGPQDGPPELQGLLPRSFSHIFNNIDTTSQDTTYLVRGSYLEIYNEEIRDLLSKNPKGRCELKDNPQGGVYVKDLSAFVVKSTEEMHQILQTGLANRAVSATQMNETSSRSHSIFMITVEQCAMGMDGEGHIRVGKLNMVDLAGSERQSKTGATGERLKEATKINLSLSALGNVISALVDGKSSHIPYRDSKLTRLLQDSLGGNTKTVMVANIGPADYNYDETMSTLRYAYRAKSIKNKPRINEDPKDAMIREYQEEIMRLKAELEAAGGVDGEAGDIAMVPLPPRVEKQVEYVDKIVEKIVEREVVVEQGPSPEEVAAMEAQLRQQNEEARLKAEAKRREVEAQRDLAESERLRLLAQIDEQEHAAMQEEQRKADLQSKLQHMEHKMVQGKQIMEQAIQQEHELKKHERRLRKQQEREAELRQQEEQQRQENLLLEERCASQEEQVVKLTTKLQKLWDKYQKAQQEMVDVQHFNQQEREDMLSMIRDLRQTLKLKALIMESFVPMAEIQNTQERAVWDAEEDEWRIQPVTLDKENRPKRPNSFLGLPRPTTEFARLNRTMGDSNPRYMFDNIVFTDLDLPERTTEDYEVQPELGDRIERALTLALSQDDDEVKEAKGAEMPEKGQKKMRPASGIKRDGAPPSAFPQARGLVSRE
ncbi:KRP95 [Symbiodinium natans]|uniref:Kinesin-like protein n=1 Tax=Symbiodinium natans TaxID=878477 RepID=A0A812QRL0_9DINO|nr:KRP95 [Symbiodinium natans]